MSEFWTSLAVAFGTTTGLLVRLVTGQTLYGTAVGSFLSGYLASAGSTPRKYVPDLGNLVQAYPELCFLFLLGLVIRNDNKAPIRELLIATNGRLTKDVRYTFFDIPQRCILLMHHRRHHHPGLTVQEFHDMAHILPRGIPFRIVSGRGWGGKKDVVSRTLQSIEERMYNAVDVRGCSKVDGTGDPSCQFKVYEPFKTQGPMIVIIFPDKFGAQRFGDRSMYYRTGAFSAALAAGVPLVDTLSMYPTFAHQYHSAKTTRIVYPNHTWPEANLTLDVHTFADYAQKHTLAIQQLRDTMQTMFFQDIETEEAKIASCDAQVVSRDNLCSRCTYVNTSNGAMCRNA